MLQFDEKEKKRISQEYLNIIEQYGLKKVFRIIDEKTFVSSYEFRARYRDMYNTEEGKFSVVWKFDPEPGGYGEEFVNELPGYINRDDELEVAHEKEQRMMQAETILSVTEDGEIELRDDKMLIDLNEWKEEDGRYFYSSGTVSIGDGEHQTNWVELEFDDGKLVLNGMKYEMI